MRLTKKKPSKKIPCYILVFDQVAIIKQSLDFLAAFSDRLELIIIENPSANTPEISKLMDAYGTQGHVKRYYCFEENITSAAYDVVLSKELSTIKKSPLVIVTDGDMNSQNADWLDEEISILDKNPDVFACGITLDKINLPLAAFPEAKDWIPPDTHEHNDFFEVYTGLHLLMVKGQELFSFMQWKQANDLRFVDATMHRYSHEVLQKKWGRTKRSKAYHLTWDLYRDKNNAYTKRKSDTGHRDLWYHSRKADYTLKEY